MLDLKISQAKLLQEDEDGQRIGRVELRNWGAMLRSQERFGPAGFPACPMFKDYIPRYRETSPAKEGFKADQAYMTMDLVNLLIRERCEKLAVHIYFAENETAENTAFSTDRFNEIAEEEKRSTIGVSKFQKMIRTSEIRIGTAFIMCRKDDSWMELTKLMLGTA